MKRLFFIFLLLLSACAKHAYFKADEDYVRLISEMRKVLLLPVINAGEGSDVFCPFKGICQRRGRVLYRGPNVIFNLLYQELSSMKWDVIIPAEVDMEELKANPMVYARKIGEKYHADGVFLTYLFLYQNKIGSSIAVSRPSSIVMALLLYSLKKKAVIWQASFCQSQKPLFENIFDIKTSIKAGFRFMDVDELASMAVKSVVNGIPKERQ